MPVLFTETANTPSAALLSQGLRESMGASPTLQIEEHHLDYSRLNDAEIAALADWLRSQYRDRPVSAVIAIAQGASQFAIRYGATIWPNARIVHANVSGAQLNVVLERGDAVVPRISYTRRMAEQALELFPDARQVWLIAGATQRDRQWMADAAADLAPLTSRVSITQVAGLHWHDLLAQLQHMPSDAVALPVIFFADAAGRSFEPADAIKEIARTANRPVFVATSYMMGSGALGSYSQDWIEAGRIAGRTVRRLLTDTSSAEHRHDVPTQWIFDAVQLRRWNLAESRLPAGALILNREQSTWQRYRRTIVATVILVAAQASIIGALLVQRRRRWGVEMALRASEEAARASVHVARDLAGKLISAREHERARLARDLHDDIGQRVASLSIALSRVKPQLTNGSRKAVRSLTDLEQQAMRLSVDLRHLSHELHPATLVHLGLLEALRERCDEFREESGLLVRLDISENWRDTPDTIGLCLYRVAQEALRNVATHARAQTATVSLDRRDGQLLMHVADDGRGFDATAPSSRSGLGLVSLDERVRMLGGVLDIRSAPGMGTRIAVHLPEGGPDAP